MKNDDDNEEAEADKPLLERLKIRREEPFDPIPHPVLRKVTSKLITILHHEVNCDNNFYISLQCYFAFWQIILHVYRSSVQVHLCDVCVNQFIPLFSYFST